MTSLLMKAAQSAAQADGVADGDRIGSNMNVMQPPQQRGSIGGVSVASSGGNGGGNSKKKGPPLRRGKWTPEEEAYANRLIQEFKAGLLPLTDGTTLRTFLSKLLNCDPMRISKKFVGSNCIGKQVFRRRTADLNRLTPDQIQKSRAELSELERRFLERVAQTNRVKSNSLVGGGGPAPPVGGPPGGPTSAAAVNAAASLASAAGMGGNPGGAGGFPGMGGRQALGGPAGGNGVMGALGGPGGGTEAPTPAWLQPPSGYKLGQGAAFAAANLFNAAANQRAAAAGRAMLGVSENPSVRDTASSLSATLSGGADPNAALRAALQRKASEDMLASAGASSADLLAQLQQRASQQSFLQGALNNTSSSASGNVGGLSNTALAQLAQNASAARLAGLGSNQSMSDLLRAGLGRDSTSRSGGLSSTSLSNAMNRQNSFDALMSLDFQSLQSIDNLANLIQTGGAAGLGNVPESGLKNADFNLNSLTAASSAGQLGTAARRLASEGRMGSLLSSLSRNDVSSAAAAANSNANLNNLLRSMQNKSESTASLLAAAAASGNSRSTSDVNLANLLRQESSTGLSSLRVQDGLSQRNTSVDDFLSLMATGDIPHQDPALLNIPLMQQQLGNQETARFLAQQQLLQSSNPALSDVLSSRSLANLQGGGGSSTDQLSGASALAMARVASSVGAKRKLEQMTDFAQLGNVAKR